MHTDKSTHLHIFNHSFEKNYFFMIAVMQMKFLFLKIKTLYSH